MRVGILVVGSLFWDTAAHRSAWREQRLEVGKSAHVFAPIRYGRRSESRANTYTMVFSRLAGRHDYRRGVGIIVPCRKPVRTSQDLFDEAEQLWIAESKDGSPRYPLRSTWGAVAALFRPGFDHELSAEWRARVAASAYPRLCHTRSERCALALDGTLAVPWPRALDGADVVNVDILLATPADPSLESGRYGGALHVARAWLNAVDDGKRYEQYFFNNVEAGIRTFQDSRIWATLAQSPNANVYRERYPGATAKLDSEQ